MDPVDLIWKNGEFVALGGRPDARPQPRPALRNRRFRGNSLLRDRARPRRLPPRRAPRPAREVGRALLPRAALHGRADPPAPRTSCCAATACAPATSGRSPSAATARLGLYAKDAPIDVIIAALPWGAYLGDESAGTRHPRQGLQLAPDQSGDSSIPHAKASGQYLNSILAKTESAQLRLRRGDPARRARLRLRGLGRERLRRPRRRALITPGHTSAILDGITRNVGGPDRHATSATPWSSATSPAPSSTWPTRSS